MKATTSQLYERTSTKLESAQGLHNRTLPSTNGSIADFLALAQDSRFRINEITEFTYFSSSKLSNEFKHESELNTVKVYVIIEPIWFL